MDSKLFEKTLSENNPIYDQSIFVSSNPLELSIFVDVYHIESPGDGS